MIPRPSLKKPLYILSFSYPLLSSIGFPFFPVHLKMRHAFQLPSSATVSRFLPFLLRLLSMSLPLLLLIRFLNPNFLFLLILLG